jgi:hypothetical protein
MGLFRDFMTSFTGAMKFGRDANHTLLEEDGTLVAIGEAECWDDLSNAIIAARLDTSSGRLDYDYYNGGVNYNSNARYPDEPVIIPVQFRHKQKYGAGAVLRPHMHWLQQQSDRPNWLLAYKKTNQGSTTTFETDYTNYTLLTPESDVFTYTSGTLLQITRFPEIDVSDVNLSGSVDFVLFRDTNNTSTLFAGADPVAGDVTVKYQDQHALFNMLGSREELVK